MEQEKITPKRSTRFTLDEADKKILEVIQEKGDISNLELAQIVELAPSSCLLRVKNLKEYGYIDKTVTLLNEKTLGYEIQAFLTVELKNLNRTSILEFCEEAKQIPQVLEVYMTTGRGTFLLKVIAKDLQDYHEIVLDKLVKLPSVSNIETSIVINTEKRKTNIPII